MEKDISAAVAWRRPSRSRWRRRTRGQALVEFAMVAPVFFMLLFGLVEFSLIGASIGAYNFGTKDGARIGSLLGRTDSSVDLKIVSDVQSRASGVVVAKTLKVEVFKSDQTGVFPTGTPECVYTPPYNFASPADPMWNCGSQVCNPPPPPPPPGVPANWPVCTRDDTLLNADYLGVKVTYQYNFLTSFISGVSALTLTATSVQRIEPQDFKGRDARPSHAPAATQLLFGDLVLDVAPAAQPSSVPGRSPAFAVVLLALAALGPRRHSPVEPEGELEENGESL